VYARSIGDLQAQHAPVIIGNSEVRGHTRFVDGSEIRTGPSGRARVRLDDGSVVVIDADTRLTLRSQKLTLSSGRVFVQGTAHTQTQIELGDVSTELSSSAAAFESVRGVSKVYCAQGELLLRRGSRQVRVASGESAALGAKRLEVSPEKAFDDWTGGLAVPWSRVSAGRPLVPELRAHDVEGLGPQLSIRSQSIDTTLDGEFAITRTRTSYFNGSERPITPHVRVALPAGAILSRVARAQSGEEVEAQIAIERTNGGETFAPRTPRLEWAGDGWISGVLPTVESGGSIELALTYGEWLPTQSGRRTYRYPLASSEEPPLIGELRARVHVRGEGRLLSLNAGAEMKGREVELARSDVRPSADLVVEMQAPLNRRAVRAYVAEPPAGEDPYVLFRTELPERADPGVSLAIVIDTSMSVGSGVLETERAMVEALLEGLGERDEVVVLAADQTVRSLGSDTPRAVSPASRAELRRELSELRPGGASNLSLALERGADVLDAESRGRRAGSGVLVYIGDGRPSMGETEPLSLRRRLSLRSGGMPRLASVAVGSGADAVFLARLTSGVGASYQVLDRSDAARVGASLLADALEPTLRDVEFDLGPNVDRVYPRDSRAVVAGSTLSVVGRLRGPLPKQAGVVFRDGRERTSERRPVEQLALPAGADVAQRWAAARIEEIAARGDGLEPTIALAASAKLLTPWTGWFFGSAGGASPTAFSRRLLEFSPTRDAPFARYLARDSELGATLLEPASSRSAGVSLSEAADIAVRRILKRAQQAVRACRDARAAVRPEVGDAFSIDISLSEAGRILRLHVAPGGATGRDAVLERCIEGVVRSLPFAAFGIAVSVNEVLKLPPMRTPRRTVCSAASRLSLPIRRAVWLDRDPLNAQSYLKAAQSCELLSFAEKREYLRLMLDANATGWARLALAKSLDEAGENDAAAFVRKEALRRVKNFDELVQLNRTISSDEPNVDAEFEKAYAAAKTREQALEVVRRFLRIAPHAPAIRRSYFGLLEALGEKEELVAAIHAMRSEPILDAGLLAYGAAALRRLGFDAEGRRAFGELLERAPEDPWTLAFVGDRLRAERLFDEAVDAYQSLQRLTPGDASALLRLALAHAGAQRLDVATRLLEVVTQTGGRDDDGRLGELASITSAVLLATASERPGSAAEGAELLRRLAQTPLPDVASVLFIQSAPSDEQLEVRIAQSERELKAPDFDAPALGISAIRVERGGGSARLVLRRAPGAGPKRALHAEVVALRLGAEQRDVRLVRRQIDVRENEDSAELRWNGEAFL
jgi:tetratricopeptide (TPR) repeat protein